MKWMFKEDHSLGKRGRPGQAPDRGPSPTPAALPGPLSRQGPGSLEPPTDPCRPPRVLLGVPEGTCGKGLGEARTRGVRTQVMGGEGRTGRWGSGSGGPAGWQARLSAWSTSFPEHRCVESAKIRAKYPDRVPVSVDSQPPHPAVTLSVLERCRAGALGRATVEKLGSQGVAGDRTARASAGPSVGREGLVLFRGISAESSDLGQEAACSL